MRFASSKKDQLKNEPRSPPALIVARAMPWAKLLSGRGVMENHLPSVLGKKRRFYVESWGGGTDNNKAPIKNRTSLPPRAGGSPRDAAGGSPQWPGEHWPQPSHSPERKNTISFSGVFTLSCDGACCRRCTTRSTVVSGCGGCVDDAWRRAKRLVTRAAREGETQVSRPSSSSFLSVVR